MRGHFDAEAFYAAIDAQRRVQQKNWKQVAKDSGVSASTLTRMAQGKRPDVDSLAALLNWSGLQADAFITKEAGEPGQPEALSQIVAFLRSDPNLKPESADAMEKIIYAAYEQFKGR